MKRLCVIDNKGGAMTFSSSDHAGHKTGTLSDSMQNTQAHGVSVFPASFAQERLWFLDQFEPDSFLYNIVLTLRLQGNVNMSALLRSVAELVARYETLRTNFVTIDDHLFQSIAPQLTILLPFLDLRAIERSEQTALVQQIAGDEAQRPFDLVHGPLIRITLLSLDAQKHLLLLTFHHAIADAWSINICCNELNMLYAAFKAKKTVQLPELPIQYADYAVWQREWLQGETLERELSYWKERLAGAPAVLELPADHPRPSIQTHHGARVPFSLPAPLAQALEELSRKKNVTLFMTLLAAFQTLLGRFTGQQDIVIGTPIAGRTQIELEGLIGLFVNTLAMRCNLQEDPTFWELLEQVREVTLAAYAHQDLPFDKLVDALHPERNLSYSPIFQVLIVLQNTPEVSSTLETPALVPEDVGISVETAKFDLTLSFWKEAGETGELVGELEYNTDLFERATIERWSKQLQTLLEGITTNPHQRLSMLPLLSDTERQQLLQTWGATDSFPSSDQCIHQLFEAQVARAPHAVALISATGEKQEYARVNRRANRLAHYLVKLGIGPEKRVGIYMERSLDLIVGVLAILKAGGAYVPLDPTYPSERIDYILADAHISALITEQPLLERLPARARNSTDDLAVICLDHDQKISMHESEANVVTGVQPANLAYIIYTSGSTGKPKGVGVCHEQVIRLFEATQPLYHFSEQDCWTLFHSIAFDFSVWEIWGALLYGGRLLVVPYWISRSTEEFLLLLLREQVTVLNQTPSAFYALQQTITSLHLKTELALRLVIFGGEALDAGQLRTWVETYGDSHPALVNMYGITETTVHVTCSSVSKSQVKTIGNSSNIGRPLSDLQVYLLDAHMQPVPPGIQGEMYVGGAGLARGYIEHPELTAERFVPHPFSDIPGTRLYRTGDLARLLSDGTFAYQGRADQQVKIRGFRIEPGEIAAALIEHPQVHTAVVVVRETPAALNSLTGGKSITHALVAYIVPEPGQAPTSQNLRAHLQERLPEYMLPALYVQLEALPLTFNGKLDLSALPAPEWGQPVARTHTAPRTPNEQILADAWSLVLKVKQIDVHTNFFEMGGDSILSLLVIARAREAGLILTPKQIFQHQTIAELGQVAIAVPAAAGEREATDGEVLLTPIQHWFFEQELPDPQHWNQSILLEVLHPLIGQQYLEQAIRHILARHHALTFRFRRSGQGWQQTSTAIPHIVDSVCLIDLSELQKDEQERTFAREAALAQASLNLESGPLVRIVYFTSGEHANKLLLVIHHLVVDGVSWRILLEDLQAACTQLLQGKQVQLSHQTASFKNWAEHLQNYAMSQELQTEKSYWLDEARQLVHPLPVDFAVDRSANREATASSIDIHLSVSETDALLHDAAGSYHTKIQDLLLTALALTCTPWTGRRTLLVDVEGHGREAVIEDIDISRTVGWFTTIFPLLLDLESVPGNAGPGSMIKTIKEQVRAAPHNGIGYGLLRYLDKEASIRSALQKMPQAEMSFNYLGQFDTQSANPTDTLFRSIEDNSGPVHNLAGLRRYLLEVNCVVTNGFFHVEWRYCTQLHRRETIVDLAQHYAETLRALIKHCCASETGGYTPSDFSGTGLSQARLDKLMTRIRSSKRT
jgi:fengycin family lipopeptide synthetase B